MEEKARCSVCGKTFKDSQALKQHFEAKHAKPEVLKPVVPRKRPVGKWVGYALVGTIIFLLGYGIFWALSSPLKEVGPLGSQHICADFAIFVDGKQVFLNGSEFFERNPYLQQERPFAGMLHMHATNVPLKLFFDSIGWELSKDCLKMEGKSYCTNQTHSLKFYVNRKRVEDLTFYVFKPWDKLLISYGNESEEEIQQQLDQIPKLAWETQCGREVA